jgi:hypothetical protein
MSHACTKGKGSGNVVARLEPPVTLNGPGQGFNMRVLASLEEQFRDSMGGAGRPSD